MTPFSSAVRPALAGLALLLAGLVAGCGSGTPAAAPATTVTVTPSTPASTAPATASPATPAATPRTGSTTTGGSAPAACPTRSLSVQAGSSEGAAGRVYQVLDFSNISMHTCTLYGFPGVALAGGSPVKQIGLAAAEDHSSPRLLITLAPGAVANVLLRIVQAANFPPSRCDLKNATYLQIFPPNQTTPMYLKYKAQACAKPVRILTVSVVKPGSGGS